MENAGAVTFRDEYPPRSRQVYSFYEQRANTILHEMAHMWFGNLVTMPGGRLVAQRILRRVGVPLRDGEGHEVPGVWRLHERARTGVSAGPTPVNSPDRCRQLRSEAVEVNFDGITTPRAPRRSSNSSPGSVRTSSSQVCGSTSPIMPGVTPNSPTSLAH